LLVALNGTDGFFVVGVISLFSAIEQCALRARVVVRKLPVKAQLDYKPGT